MIELRGLGRSLQLSHGPDGIKAVLFGAKRKGMRPMLAYATADLARVRLAAEANFPSLWLDRSAFDLAAAEIETVREFLGKARCETSALPDGGLATSGCLAESTRQQGMSSDAKVPQPRAASAEAPPSLNTQSSAGETR